MPSAREREALDVFVERLYAHCGDRVRSVILFGSMARGDAGPDSDIDVLVALTNDDPRLRSQVRRSGEQKSERRLRRMGTGSSCMSFESIQ